MHAVRKLIEMFWIDVVIKLSRAMAYKTNFIMAIFFNLLFSFIAPLIQLLIYKNTPGYPGWSFEEMLVFQAVLLFWLGLIETLFGEVRPTVSAVITHGAFDRFLLLPYPTSWIILTSGFNYRGLGTMLNGLAAMIYFVWSMSLEISWWHYALFFVYLVSGILFYMSLLLLYSTLALWLVRVDRLKEVIDQLIFFGNFPAQAFSGGLRIIYMVFLPMAIWVHYPAQALLGRTEDSSFYAIVIAVAFLVFANVIWRYQLKKYTSAGG